MEAGKKKQQGEQESYCPCGGGRGGDVDLAHAQRRVVETELDRGADSSLPSLDTSLPFL